MSTSPLSGRREIVLPLPLNPPKNRNMSHGSTLSLTMATMSSEKDLKEPKLGKYVAKYLKGVEGIPVEHRIRIFRFVENIALGTGAVCYLTESMHRAGSPQAQ
jgi:aromatic ring hydroxylase